MSVWIPHLISPPLFLLCRKITPGASGFSDQSNEAVSMHHLLIVLYFTLAHCCLSLHFISFNLSLPDRIFTPVVSAYVCMSVCLPCLFHFYHCYNSFSHTSHLYLGVDSLPLVLKLLCASQASDPPSSSSCCKMDGVYFKLLYHGEADMTGLGNTLNRILLFFVQLFLNDVKSY